MATNDLQFTIDGTTTTVISHAAALSNAGWTYSGLTGCTMTDFDNSTDKYPHLRLVLDMPDTFAAAPTAGGYVNVYMLILNSDGTSDDIPAPDSTALKAAKWICAIPIQAYDVAQRVTAIVHDVLGGVTGAQFFIENKCGQQISYTSAPTTLKATSFTYNPAA